MQGKGIQKVKKVLGIIADKIYLLLMFGILIATIVIDKNNKNNKFENEAGWPNAVYYLIALVILAGLAWFYCMRKGRTISDRTFHIIILSTVVFTLVLQWLISGWVPAIKSGDFGNAHNMAIKLARGGDFTGSKYYALHPNNVNLAVLLSWLFAGSWRVVIWIAAACTTFSAAMMAYVIKKVTGNRYVAVILCVLGECLAALNIRAFLPYSDNLAMPFIIAMLLVLCSGMRNSLKAPLIVLFAMIGAWIKVTALIPLVGILIYCFLTSDLLGTAKRVVSTFTKKGIAAGKWYLISLVLLIAIPVGGWLAGSMIKKHYHYEQSNEARGWQFMFMVGQDESNTGQVGGSGYAKAWTQIQKDYTDRKDRLNACKDTALKWIRERGFFGNLYYYTKALNVAFNDGSFHNVQPFKSQKVDHNLIFDIFSEDGSYHKTVAGVRQVMWDFVLILMALPILLFILRKKRAPVDLVFEITLVGIIFYLFLFEGRSKYLYMFLPMIMAFAGIMMDHGLKVIKERGKNATPESTDVAWEAEPDTVEEAAWEAEPDTVEEAAWEVEPDTAEAAASEEE